MDRRAPDRAVEVQDALPERSQQRAAKIVDLLIAPAAEAAGLVALHNDHDFDLIARGTDQPNRMDRALGHHLMMAGCSI